MQNETQYDLDRKAANIFAFFSNNLDKYQYLTGEDLALKPSSVEQTKLGYSPLDKIFNKRLEEEEKKEGLLKRLKNIEDRGKKKQLDTDSKSLKSVSYFGQLSTKGKELLEKIKKEKMISILKNLFL